MVDTSKFGTEYRKEKMREWRSKNKEHNTDNNRKYANKCYAWKKIKLEFLSIDPQYFC